MTEVSFAATNPVFLPGRPGYRPIVRIAIALFPDFEELDAIGRHNALRLLPTLCCA